MFKEMRKVYIGTCLVMAISFVSFSVLYKPQIKKHFQRSLPRDSFSDVPVSITTRTNVSASVNRKPDVKTLPDLPYHRIDAIPEKTEKLPFLKNFKNPCWRESTGGSSSTIRCLPYFYLVGAAKCGTTDLHRRLIRHPKISSTVEKELHWISKRRNDAKLSTYLRHFAKAVSTDILPSGQNGYHDAIIGDFSPTTLWLNFHYYESTSRKFTSNADVIYHLNPETKIIVTLRNPVERAYSDFKHFNPGASPSLFHSTVVETIQTFNNRCKNITHLKPCIDQLRGVGSYERRGRGWRGNQNTRCKYASGLSGGEILEIVVNERIVEGQTLYFKEVI